MDVVGGPVASNGRVLVLVRDASKATWLQAVDPVNGHVLWRYRWSFSEITAGVATPPVAHGDIALLLAPGPKNDGRVRLEGVRISTGRIVWHGGSTAYVTDAPTSCPQPVGVSGFCLTFALSNGATGLIALTPQAGRVLAVIPRLIRGISTTAGIYQAATKSPTLVNVRVPNGIRWAKNVTALFGANHDPDYGWDVARYDTVYAGTIGHRSGPRSRALGGDVTVGFADTTGKRVWSIPGLFQCGGALGIQVAFTCRLTGSAVFAKSSGVPVPSKDATLTLEGFDPQSGRVTWQQKITNLAEIIQGNAAFADDHHLLVDMHGAKQLLDLTNGRPASPNATYWCSHENAFAINPPKGISPQRIGSNRYTACDMNKQTTTKTPSPSATVGVTIGKTFVYASPTALLATRP
jgi:outer membrane protein assembly factor BamB